MPLAHCGWPFFAARSYRTIFVSSLAALALNINGYAQSVPQGTDSIVDTAERQKVIDGALGYLKIHYVYLDIAAKMDESIRAHCANGDYDKVADTRAFAELLTAHLQEVSHDLHLRVVLDLNPNPEHPQDAGNSGHATEFEAARRDNFGFSVIQVLAGNVGYLDFNNFSALPEAKETCIAAMNFLANTDARIIDLRRNHGGSTNLGDLLSSYLFDGSVHLYDVYFRDRDKSDSHFTTKEVRGRRFGASKPLFILTSRQTISCAEGFADSLRGLKRATIVGETTAGGAHTVGKWQIDERFSIWVPRGHVIIPGEKTDWEGTGIEPDIKTDFSLALKTAHLAALDKLLEALPLGKRHDELARIHEVVAQYKVSK